MAIADCETREERIEWLQRPINWAFHLSFDIGLFGFVYCWFNIWDAKMIAYTLSAVLAVNAGLLIWGISRLTRATRP